MIYNPISRMIALQHGRRVQACITASSASAVVRYSVLGEGSLELRVFVCFAFNVLGECCLAYGELGECCFAYGELG